MDENTPENFICKYITAVKRACRGEAVTCLVHFFKSRKITNRIQ